MENLSLSLLRLFPARLTSFFMFAYQNPSLLLSFGIPTPKSQTFTYIGSTNNVSTIVYKNEDGTTLGTLTFTYAAAGAANDDLVSTITRT